MALRKFASEAVGGLGLRFASPILAESSYGVQALLARGYATGTFRSHFQHF